jgi:hypothetical protein
MTTPAPTTPNPKRRWLQFSLWTLMVLIVLVSVPLGWLAFEITQGKARREAVVAIRQFGGQVQYDTGDGDMLDPFGSVIPKKPEWLRKLLGDDFFATATLVDLSGNKDTDAGLVHLRGMTGLRVLTLNDSDVTDAGLAHLRGLTKLEGLDLRNAKATDAGLVHLQGLKKLEVLDLSNTQVTDAGLVHLERLTELIYLDLGNTRVTDAGVAELDKALPNCIIPTQ